MDVIRHPIDPDLARVLPAISAELARVDGSLLDVPVQLDIDARLRRFAEWNAWIAAARRPPGTRPWCVGPGLPITPAFLVGLSRALFPGFELSPYDVGPMAVTEVTAKMGASAQSHSQNDLPAPPHTAGFFDPEPPLIAVFACVRPHPGGGAATTVVDIERVLAELPPAHVEALQRTELHYSMPRRLGDALKPLRVLSCVHGLPFVRFRMDYTPDSSDALDALDVLIRQERHQFVVPLAAGEVVFLWNGAPHGRQPQRGETPLDPDERRLLLRCRLRLATRH